MAWVKLDDNFPDHHKLAECGYLAPLAGWLYVCGLCYCNRQLTDGRIPRQHVHRLTHFKHVQFESATIGAIGGVIDEIEIDDMAGLLVSVGLWDQPDGPQGDYWVHDYLQYQPSKADIKAQRAAVAERVGRHRHGRNAVTDAVTDAVTGTVTDSVSNSSPDPDPDPGVPGTKEPISSPTGSLSSAEPDDPPGRATPARLQGLWNTHSPPLPQCRELSSSRLTAARARCVAHGSLDYWEEVIAAIAQTPFCLGENDRGWKATFDWLVRPDTAARVLEGKYQRTAVAGTSRATAGNVEVLRRFVERGRGGGAP